MTNKEAIKELENMRNYNYTLAPTEVFDMAIKALEQEPKTGHWEWVQYDGNPYIGNWHCSECGSIVIECVSKEKKGGIPLYKYCPQCGVKIE